MNLLLARRWHLKPTAPFSLGFSTFSSAKRITSGVAGAFAILAFPAGLFGQVIPNNSEDVLRIDTSLVTVPVFVTNARNHRVIGLSAADFNVRDQGEPVQISFFGRGTERVGVVFALDASGSARGIAQQQRLAATALLSRFGSESAAAVLRFSDEPELVVPFTRDNSRVQSAFLLSPLEGHHTAIFNAAAAAVRSFKSHGADPKERRIVILISDGLDTISTIKPQAVEAEAVANGVSFYVIHLPLFWPVEGRLVPRPAAKGFKELAERTGGRYFRIGTPALALDPKARYDLSPAFDAIEADLSGQYVLGYYLPEARRDGRPHHIEVRLSGQNHGLRVTVMRDVYATRP